MDKYIEYYREQFYQEAREILEKVSDAILKAEADPNNQELLNSVFRGIHTIKGSAGSFGLDDIADFSHHFENLLSALRGHKILLTSDMVDVVLAGADHIGKMIECYASGKSAQTDQELVERFISLGKHQKDEAEKIKAEKQSHPQSLSHPIEIPLLPEVQKAFQEAVALGLYVFRIRLKYSSELFEYGYDPRVFLQNLKQSCTFYHAVIEMPAVPDIAEFNPFALYLYPTVYVATALDREEICDLTFDPELIVAEAVHVRTDILNTEPLHEFVDTAMDMLESMEKAVIDYETSGSRDALNEIFRTVHNFKGDADLVGLEEITVFAHTLESLLERLRAGTIHRTFGLIDVILQSVDFLRQSVTKLGQGIKIPDFPPVFETLKHYAAMKDDLDRKQYFLKDISPELREVFIEQANQYKKIIFEYTRTLPLAPEHRIVIERALKGLAKASAFIGLKSVQIQSEKAVAALKENDNETLSEVIEKITAFIDSLNEEDEEPEQKFVPRISSDDTKFFKKESEPEVRTMRIEEQKVDHFTNMIGELLIARNTYAHLLKQLEKETVFSNSQTSGGSTDLEGFRNLQGLTPKSGWEREKTVEDTIDGSTDPEGFRNLQGLTPKSAWEREKTVEDTIKSLKENLHLFSRLTNDIHHGVMSLRMIPVGRIFQKFNRVVRDIARKQKKFIQLLTDGEDIEIDKKVADMLSEPLVHMVRNACDHGIESPDVRKSAGKPEKGTVIIRASHEGGNLCIQIIDDGKGIDRQKLYEKAKQAGFAVESPDDPNLLNLAFMPGLTTSSEVSDISGRGVGLDVVKNTVRSLGGMVRLISNEGKGMEITLSIPITLGIDTVLFVDAGGMSYAIPLEHIVETLKIPFNRIRRAGTRMLFHHRGEVLPAQKLEILLQGAGSKAQVSTQHSELRTQNSECPVVIIKTMRGKYGLIVDRLDKNTEVAIKPLPGILAGIDIVSGVSIMGDGRVFLILDPEKF